jgi:ribosomal protein S18 acetylase RimI-like enzyme
MQIREAIIPEEIPLVRGLFREYAVGLGFDLGPQGFDKELAGLPGRYARPAGGVWLAVEDGDVAGCVALRPLDARQCEIKRLYVRPTFRGRGVGRMLAESVLRAAVDAGYHRVCLDTMPSMVGAIALYRALGFTEVEAYWDNPMPGAIFLGRTLA